MSDILASYLNSSTGSSSSSASMSEQLVASYKASQQDRLDTINNKISSLNTKKTFYSNLKTKLNSLVGNLDTYDASDINDEFATKKVTLSDSDYFSVEAEGNALIGTTTAKVNRLATNDTLVSRQMTLDDTTAFSDITGDQNISFTVNDKTINVTVNFTGTETAKEAMTKIANAINKYDVDEDGDEETDDLALNATLVQDTDTTGRLSFTSSETGADYAVKFTDSAVLAKLGITTADLTPEGTSRTVATETGAGYQNASKNLLNSEVILGGIKVSRNSNEIEDALTGMTITLTKAQETTDSAITINTDVNTDAVKDFVTPLITAYNELVQFVSSSTTVLRSESSINNLRYTLRSVATEAVSGLSSGNPTRLTELGIKVKSDGTLSFSSTDDLETLLKDDPQKVADLFTSADGFIAKLNDAIEGLTGSNNLITSRTLSLTSQIDDLEDRYSEVESLIDKQADTMRKQYESMLEVYLEAQSQYSLVSSSSSSY